MMKSKNNKQNQKDVPFKKRGRPAGKNRVPLSLEERRARNALYERERRNETAEAMTQLAEAVSCDPNIANADLLATVISQLQRRNSDKNIDDLKRINVNLESQIASLQAQLGLTGDAFDNLDSEEFQSIDPPSTSYHNHNEQTCRQKNKRKRSRLSSEQSAQKEKRLKTRSETSNDSGIEMQRHSISPTELGANTQLLASTEQQLPLETIVEEDQHVSQATIELQAEIYKQIYKPDSLNSTHSIEQQWNDTSTTHSLLDSLTQSLINIPPIIYPQAPCDTTTSVLESPNVQIDNIDINDFPANENEMAPLSVEATFDLLTDNERGLISNWLDDEYLASGDLNDQTTSNYNLQPGFF